MVDWDEIVRGEGPGVWRTIYRLVRHQADADECFQETFVAAWQWSHGQNVANWPALLKRLAITRAIDRLRRRLRSSRREDAIDVATLPANEAGPREQAAANELAAGLRWALSQLPAHNAEVFCLPELEGWTYQEIANHFCMSTSATGVLLHRTRRKLQDLMAPIHQHRS